ncbi:UBA domain-containing protein 7 [Ephemerocybe angulata]|uniref:UBA domain-containing protein 7 n=1 Tax=Ephemerocybe angulata TaxID=980116 RepID=A0A8H6M131_9AGAR|nr:UBA domain-containing protein 7 [Tulosesus angulatus]
MSDSFADLWSSTTPSQPQKAVPLSQQKPAAGSYTQSRPKHDVFALLSQSSAPAGRNNTGSSSNLNASRSGSSLNSSSPASRSLTPSLSSGSTSRPGSSLSTSKPALSGDAFNDLFGGGSLGGSGKSSATLTIAERAALAEQQRQAAQAPSTSSQSVVVDQDDDWGLGDFAAPATAKPRPQQQQHRAPKSDSLLDFDGFDSGSTVRVASTKPPATQQTKSSGSLWDLDDFTSDSSSSAAQATPQSKPRENFDSPDFDFDFGNREDKDPSPSNGNGHHEEDDILGMLSKPVDVVRATTPPPAPSTSSSRRPTRAPRSSSPPPHVLGQIVEMGFSIQQAKTALAKTETGTDVQAALDMLLGGGGDSAPSPTSPETNTSSRHSPPPQRRFTYDDEEDPQFAATQRRRPQRQSSTGDGSSTPNIQDQADKIIAQASEIGLSVLSKASLFWKEGKEKALKVYEERAGVGNGSTDRGFPPPRNAAVRDTRPKWMQDIEAHNDEEPETPRAGGFRDDHDEAEGGAFRDDEEHRQRPDPSRGQRGAPSGSTSSSQARRPAAQPEPDIDLFSSAPVPAPAPVQSSEPKAYVSPWRRKKPAADSSPAPAPPTNASRPAPAPSRPKPKRRLPSCPEMTLDIVRGHKTKGTEAFKLGQYSVAVEEYSKAITMLPDRHLLLVPLYTNRALARIRCGECKGAVEDAGGALGIISSENWKGWHPSNEGGWELDGGHGEANGGYGVQREKGAEWNDAWGRGADLKDGWLKAVKRRAEAFEGMEKWNEAKKDWEVLSGGGWVDGKTRQEAVRGLGRCKKILGAEGGGAGGSGQGNSRPAAASAPPAVKPRPKLAPARSNAAPSGAAVKAYREQVNAAEAEDALKHQLKDTVEAKLLGWKKGKETNLRALLASLDTVLWEEVIKDMGGKPGLADLVSGGGVKKWYMKSVARVHPDKLNANNSTVEQRMIAGGVFGALNEAWLAFKQ